MRTIRVLLVLAGALVTAAATTAPAAAFRETLNSGPTGFYTVNDANGQPGVVCRFEDTGVAQNDELDSIRVTKVWSHGPLPQDTWVGYRYIIRANAKPYSDGIYDAVFQSPIVKGKANDAEVAFFGPFTWKAPEGTTARYRVQLVFLYYAPGSQTNVTGRVRGLMEVYRHRLNAGNTYPLGSEGAAGWCRRNYHFSN